MGSPIIIDWIDVLRVGYRIEQHSVQVRVQSTLFNPWLEPMTHCKACHSVHAVDVCIDHGVFDVFALEVLDWVVDNLAVLLVQAFLLSL